MKNKTKTKLPKICLNMIVKNEAHVIEECLNSIVHLVDYYVINDTGSTDNTREVIKTFFNKHNIKGEIIDHEFRTCKCHGPEYKKYDYFHFGWNRTYALEKCIGKSEYIFIMDADDVVEGTLRFPQNLVADQYYLKFRTDFNNYVRPQLIKNDPKYKWEYKDGLHEFLHSDYPNLLTYTLIDDYAINSRRLGDRNKDPKKYLKDVDFLKILIKERPDYSRYKHFYAQSLYDAKLYKEAIDAYEEYIPFEKFEEAKYLAMLMIGRAWLKIDTSINNEKNVLKAFQRCFDNYPEYAEPMYEICKYYNALENYEEAYKYGKKAVDIKLPFNKVLSIDTEVYNYKLLDEMIWCATETKRYDEAIKWSQQLLDKNKYPKEQKTTIETNILILKNLKTQFESNDITSIKRLLEDSTNPIIGFYLGPSPIETIYGSELAAQYLAKEFLSNDKTVVFFADEVKKYYISGGIIYLPAFVLKRWQEVNLQLETMIVSRYVNYFIEVDAKLVSSKTFMWLHDINIHPYYNGSHLPNSGAALVHNIDNVVDGYICSSEWHKTYLQNSYKLGHNKIHIIGLGIDTNFCKKLQTKKIKNRFIWVSDYQRGLEDFLTKFITIKSKIPDAELHIYRELPDLLKDTLKKIDNIKLFGHVDNKTILKAMSEAEYFCYVTTFPETFCLSALEAQALGCICITSHIAALETTVADRGLIIDPNSSNFIEQFMKLHNDPDKKQYLRNTARDWAMEQSWTNKCNEWLNIIKHTSANHTSLKYTSFDKMFERLATLKQFGFDPKYVLDIGANIGDWTIKFKNIYPNADIKAFEANPQCEKYLRERNIDYTIALLGNKNKECVDFYYINDCTTGASIFREQTSFYNDPEIIKLPMKRLDSIIKDQSIDLIKLDVQGSELYILDGAINLLKKTDFVLLEVAIMKYNNAASSFCEVINYMSNCGFNVYDIVENHYINNCCVQADILFLNKNSKWPTIIANINKEKTFWKVDNIYEEEV